MLAGCAPVPVSQCTRGAGQRRGCWRAQLMAGAAAAGGGTRGKGRARQVICVGGGGGARRGAGLVGARGRGGAG
jgi:hypothetical protein